MIQFYKNFSFKRDIIDRFKNVNIKKSSLIVITVFIISILFILLYISSNRYVINKNENNNDRIRELKKQTKKIDTIDVTNTLKVIFNRMRIKFQNCLFLIYNFIMIDDFD